jgi:hypothetical protein
MIHRARTLRRFQQKNAASNFVTAMLQQGRNKSYGRFVEV